MNYSNLNVNMSSLNEEEKRRLLYQMKHAGHEEQHLIMFLIFILAIVITQLGLIVWKKHYPKNYQNISMIGMWLIPLFISIYKIWFRFISIWLIITLLTLALIWRPLITHKMNASTPRLIYKWFYYLYSSASMIAVTGYILIISTFMGINLFLRITPEIPLNIGFILLFYGLYWGVLTRDFTDYLVDILTANIGYYSSSSNFPLKYLKDTICAICGRSIEGILNANHFYENEDFNKTEKAISLTCGHRYHEYCIYGWCLIGKKQICPFCREKVDTRKLFASLPFQRPHYLFGNLLDFIRYLVVWQPLILFFVQFINYLLGLE